MSAPVEALRLEPPRRKMSASQKALWGVVGFLVLAKLIELVVHMPVVNPSQTAIFAWKWIAFFAILALLGSGFAHIITFPGMWDPAVDNRDRIWKPLGIGLAFGAALLAVSHAARFAAAQAAAIGSPSLLHVPFPYSLLFYLYTGVCSSIFYCLFPIAFTVWFFGTLLLARRWPRHTFWTMAVLVSFWEPLTMAGRNHWALLRQPHVAGIVALLALLYAADFTAACLFRRFGFLAALALRLSLVVVWNIIGKV
ncbi:MAG TPA: hypothetical protein VGS20_13870 [Candidatus Acidoferrales bacterium]|nr:hypothetical protein [Candidatus Acidoferrales bacterium]